MPSLAQPPDAGAARRLKARLRDIELHLDAYAPQVVESQDGRVYLAANCMVHNIVQTEPYPYLTPNSRLERESKNLDFANAAAVARIEDRLVEYGMNNLEDRDRANMLTRANPCGFKGHAFQVVWSGTRRQWLVLEGRLTWYEKAAGSASVQTKTHEYERLWLNGENGFIVLPISVQPYWPDTTPGSREGSRYTLTVNGPPKLVAVPQQTPPELTIQMRGTLSSPGFSATQTWSPGKYDLIIARVLVPDGTRRPAPHIVQFVTGRLEFRSFDLYGWDGARPRIYAFPP